jgi:esterase/lipase superfamily enzyme
MRTAQIAYDLGEPGEGSSPGKPFGIPFMFSWPSAGGSTWAPLLYPYDQESSRFAIEHFKHVLKLVIARTGARKVHLIAHSMGNVPLLNALAGLEEWADGRQIVEQVILASPDVDIGEFKRLAAKVRPLTGGMTLYASSRDSAMECRRRFTTAFRGLVTSMVLRLRSWRESIPSTYRASRPAISAPGIPSMSIKRTCSTI